MYSSIIRPNTWVAIRLPSGVTRNILVTPNATISLGKYGSFPANLIIERPYHVTFEIEDQRPDEKYSRIRIVPASELYAEIFADEESPDCSAPTVDAAKPVISAEDGVEFTLVDAESGKLVTRSSGEVIDENARQTLTQEEIEELKREGSNAGKDVIAKLMLSHTALDQKTSFSLAKYKLLKTKKYIRRFQILPVDVPNLAHWQLEERDASKILDLRAEMIALVGSWGNVHYGGDSVYLGDPMATCEQGEEALAPLQGDLLNGRWLVVDDTGGLLVAAIAERMGVLFPELDEDEDSLDEQARREKRERREAEKEAEDNQDGDVDMADADDPANRAIDGARPKKVRSSDFAIPYSQTNTITVVHSASQPSLPFLGYWDFDAVAPSHAEHPLCRHLMCLTWLQLLKPELDTAYSTPPLTASPELLGSWKPSRRGNFHRKRRRFARTRHVVEATRAGGFSGLVCASTMDPISILKHTLPLLAGGAPVSMYSPTLEPLAALADCFSVSRRTAWTSGTLPEMVAKTVEELERWEGSEQFPLNPTLLLGTSIQTSRARRWQVLPGRTHPLMTERGGTDGYVFTAWRAKPAAGKVAAKGKFKRRKLETGSAAESEAADTPKA
ncbi:Gcd10p family-domain-containing protein [Lasiosphaeris hirsuta]|uniref:tRNA (adenine(58)-N(1))-methyltransferase non-catalytic subunit TRM6 n=1 Tax=Lasiosphaeris hirsuta TaxID=260670 RepID=A0AA40AYM4_9PEZI|nr:Gcd10p family-domain-containing protein [Lasiosphaeris hirsuta]